MGRPPTNDFHSTVFVVSLRGNAMDHGPLFRNAITITPKAKVTELKNVSAVMKSSTKASTIMVPRARQPNGFAKIDIHTYARGSPPRILRRERANFGSISTSEIDLLPCGSSNRPVDRVQPRWPNSYCVYAAAMCQ